MTNRVLIKRSSVANSVPSASALEYGEFALNYSDGNLFFKNSGNVVTTLVSTQFVNVSGNVTGNYFFGNGSQLTGVVASSANAESLTGTFLPNNVVTSNLTTVGVLGTLSVTGNANVGNLGTTGNVTAGYFLGNGSQLTGILTTANAQTLTGTYLSANVLGSSLTSVGTLGNLSVTGNANVGNLNATNISGTLTTAAQPNVTSVGTLSGLTVSGESNYTGNVNITGNLAVTGNLNYQNVTDLVVGDPLIFIGANNNANLFDLGEVTQWNDGTLQYGGIVRDASDGVWKVFGNVYTEPTTTVDFTNAIYQPLRTGAATFAGANINGALTGATSGAFSGNVTTGNVSGETGAFTNVGGTLTTASQTNITSVGTLGSLGVTGNANVGNISATNGVFSGAVTGITTIDASGNANVGNLGTNGNITAGYFIGNGSQLTGVIASSANAETLTGTFLANNVVTSNLTTVGTLNSLSVTGNANVGNIGATNAVITNSLSAGNITASGNVSATYVVGDGSYLTGITSLQSDYLFANVVSGVSPYYQSDYIGSYVAGTVATATQSVGGTAVMLAEFLTNAGYPNQSYLPMGTIGVQYQTQKDNGSSTYVTYAEIWKRTSSGTETLLLTSDVTPTSSVNTLIQQQTSTTNNSNIPLNPTDRIAIKIYAQISSGPTSGITLSWDGATQSGFYLPAPTASVAQFIPYQNAVSNVALGSYGLSAGYLTTAGNATVGNLDVGSGNVFSGNLIATDVIFSTTMVATGNVTAIGNISANYFVGNGSQLTGLSSNSIYNGNSNVSIASASANVTMGINGDANTVVISPGSIFVNGLFASPKTITSNVQMAEDSTAIIISPLTIASGYSMTVPTSSTLYVWIPS